MVESTLCTGCGACAAICAHNSITMTPDKEGFCYPIINSTTCTKCNACEKTCPVLSKNTPHTQTTAYAAQINNESIRLQSSSGGFFSLLAEYVLEQNGIVFGAALNKSMTVEHIYVSEKEELAKLRGSKYVQSNIGNTYHQAKQFLLTGKLVLFTGTPCQIEGLLKYLGKNYKNLITQDIICHGTPSPVFWKKYLEWHESKESSLIKTVSFRNKQSGWKTFSMHLTFENGKQQWHNKNTDIFLRGFLSDMCLRPSCHNCSFKGMLRASDFTLADFWKVHEIAPDMDDDKGTSLILVNSHTGHEIFDRLKTQMKYRQVDTEDAVSFNSAITQSVPRPAERNEFMDRIQTQSVEEVVNRYCPKISKTKRFIKRAVRKAGKMLKIHPEK